MSGWVSSRRGNWEGHSREAEGTLNWKAEGRRVMKE